MRLSFLIDNSFITFGYSVFTPFCRLSIAYVSKVYADIILSRFIQTKHNKVFSLLLVRQI